MNRITRIAATTVTVVAFSATAALAGTPTDANHGDAVSEIAKAADFASGRAHGAAVSAEAKTWGAIRSAEARAKAKAHAAQGKANGLTRSEPGRLRSEAARD
jgi:hypothetical protein